MHNFTKSSGAASRSILSAIALAVVTAIAWWLWFGANEPKSSLVDLSPTDSAIQTAPDETTQGEPSEYIDGEPKASSYSEHKFQRSPELAEWQQNRGYYMDLDAPDGVINPTHSYDSLDDQALEQLSLGGDMVAATMLGDRLLRSLDPSVVEKGLEMHEEATLLGSTYSSQKLGAEYLAKDVTGDPLEDIENVTTGLAWMIFTSDRGDPGGNVGFRAYSESRKLGAGLLNAACSRAESLRREIAEERKRRGYEMLDDSPPPGLEKLPSGTSLAPLNICQ